MNSCILKTVEIPNHDIVNSKINDHQNDQSYTNIFFITDEKVTNLDNAGQTNNGFATTETFDDSIPDVNTKDTGVVQVSATDLGSVQANQNGTHLTLEDKEGRDIGVHIQKSSPQPLSNVLKFFVVVLNCFMLTLPIGLLYSLGVLFVSIIEEFNATRAEASPMLSIYTAILFGLGGVFGPLMNRFNGGYICMIGGALACIGGVVSFLAPSVLVLIFSNGIMIALGLSAPFLLPFIIVGELFVGKQISTMLSVCAFSPGIAAVIFPYLTAVLMDMYGWRGVFLIYGGLTLNCIPIGLLNTYIKNRLKNISQAKPVTNWKDMLTFSLFRKSEFLVFVFCVFLVNTLFPTINLFFVDMVMEKGYDISTGSALLSINGFVNVGGRVVNIILQQFCSVPMKIQWAVYLFIVSITISFYVLFDQYEYLLATSILYGFFWGMCIISYPSMLMEIAGPKRYANAMGYCNLIGGISGLAGAPVAGFIKDTTGSYDIVYYSTTGFTTVACILLLVVFISKRKKKESMNYVGDYDNK